jgi:transcriptional regulator with XRE-family HTH domain
MAESNQGSDGAVLAELGERLRAARLARNLSQQKLAAEAGVGRMTVQRLEEGGSASLTSLIRILRALDELDGLARLLPSPGPSPLEEARRQGRRRQRARSAGAPPPPKPQHEPWRWGDERPGDGS